LLRDQLNLTQCAAMVLALGLSMVCAQAPLVWGADAQGGAPFVFQDPHDPAQVIGFEVELADLLAAQLGRTGRHQQAPYDKLLELVARGDFDVAINGLEVADEKKRLVELSTPYFATTLKLTVRRDDERAPRSLSALAGRAVGTLPGSLAERTAQRAHADVKTYEGGQDEVYQDLALGRTDAVLLDAPITRYFAEHDARLEVVPGDFGTLQYAIALRRDSPALRVEIDAALERLKADGSLRALYERWGLWNQAAAELLGGDPLPRSPAPELDRWLAATRVPSWGERLKHRYPTMLPLLLQGAALTLVTSVLAMLLAIVLGVSLAVGRRFGPRAIRWLCAGYVEFFRGTPLLIQLTIIYFGLPELGLKLPPFVAGVVALGLNYAAAEAENYRAGLESVPQGQLEAAQVLGLTRTQALRFVIGPQALRVALPPTTNDFIALLKDSSLVSVVTLTELTKTYTSLANATRDHLGLGLVVALLYLLLGLPFASLARWLERRLGRHVKRGAA
jgi:polar amino acid transport system substrate-binding protein